MNSVFAFLITPYMYERYAMPVRLICILVMCRGDRFVSGAPSDL